MDTSRDTQEIRCPRLGSTVSFYYCRTCGDSALPCFKAADCWWERFDILSFLRENLARDQFETLMAKKQHPQPKVASLLELIEQARNRI